jgi:drug/metabolite transporter (DMT)-like permease
MSWILVAVSAYLILAIANLLDKFLVDNVLLSAKAYAFAACLLSNVVFLAAPWFLKWPGLYWFGFDLLMGGIFAVALWFLYEALRRGEAARVLVIIGGSTPIFSLLLSLCLFKERLVANEWLGLLCLLIGIVIIACLPQTRSFLTRVMHHLRLKHEMKAGGLIFAVASALAFSVYFIGTKFAYGSQPFASAFIWTKVGAGLFVLLFLVRRRDRQELKASLTKKHPAKNKFLVVFNQLLGSVGFILQNYAISLGSVVLVNALQGVQYAFLLIISAGLALLAPKLLKETFSWRIILQKLAAVAVIGLGLYILAF